MATIRTREIEEEVLSRLSKGEPLAWICRDLGFHVQTWATWRHSDPDLNIAHGRARDEGFDAIAAETLAIADDSRNDYVQKLGPDGETGGVSFNAENVQRSKLRIETRLKLLAKWDPRRYGDKLDVTTDGQKLQSMTPVFNVTLSKEE